MDAKDAVLSVQHVVQGWKAFTYGCHGYTIDEWRCPPHRPGFGLWITYGTAHSFESGLAPSGNAWYLIAVSAAITAETAIKASGLFAGGGDA